MGISNKHSLERGFSLIEVAIAMIVIGLLLTAALQTYNIYQQRRETALLESRFEVVKSALSRYVYRYGRYPLPARRDSALGSATIGREVAIGTVVACPAVTAPTGAVCRTTTNTINADTFAGNDGVLIGDVPFATLGIRYDNIMTPWGSKFIYAISENLTTIAAGVNGYHESYGAIEVLSSAGATVFTGAGTPKAHYVVLSTGPNRVGAFGMGGAQISQCTGAGRDRTNCDTDGRFNSNMDYSSLPTAYSYGKILINEEIGANNFDDKMIYTNSSTFGIWSKVAAPVVGQVSVANTNTQNIKIGNFSSSCGAGCTTLPFTKVDVEGAVRANEIRSSRWCGDFGPSGCTSITAPLPAGTLSPATIGGVPTTPGATSMGSGRFQNSGGGILCASNMAMRGIYQGDEICAETAKFSTITNVGTCGAGFYAVGLNTDGTLCCNDPMNPCH